MLLLQYKHGLNCEHSSESVGLQHTCKQQFPFFAVSLTLRRQVAVHQ